MGPRVCVFPRALSVLLLGFVLVFVVGPESGCGSPSPVPRGSRPACAPRPASPDFRLVHPRNGTLYVHNNRVVSTVRIESVESWFPVELSLYRHASDCASSPSCGYGTGPRLSHVATHVHEEGNDLWLTHDWGTLTPGVYVLHAFATSNSNPSPSIPDVSHYRSCFEWDTTNTFVVIHNDTVWQSHDQRNQQVYHWRLVAMWAELNGASGFHQFDLVFDSASGSRSIRARRSLPPNTEILTIPLHLILQPVSFIGDTPFLRDIITMDHFFHNITDLYQLNAKQNTYFTIMFILWCLAREEQCYWIHFVRSWPHVDFYLSSIAHYRRTGTLPHLSFTEYREHAPSLPLLWTNLEVIQWASTTAYSHIAGERKSHIQDIQEIFKLVSSSVLSVLHLPPRVGSPDSGPLHPFVTQLITWCKVMRITRSWKQKYYIAQNYTWMNQTGAGLQMKPVMDMFDHHDDLGTFVHFELDTPHVSVYSHLNQTISKDDSIYLLYAASMTPLKALLHYGWIMPESSHFVSISIQPRPSPTTMSPQVQSRFKSVQTVLTQLNIPSTSTFVVRASSSRVPPLLLFRLRLLFYEFEACAENPNTAHQLVQTFQAVDIDQQDVILSSASERAAHEFLRDLICNNVRLPEREQDNHEKENEANNGQDKDKMIEPVGQATILFNDMDEHEDELKLGSRDSSSSPSIPPYHVGLLPDSHYEDLLNSANCSYHNQALALFTLSERKLARYLLTLIDKHQPATHADSRNR